MSTAAISTTTLSDQYFQNRNTDLHQLGQDLGSGNLSAAQADVQDIATLTQTGPFGSGVAFSDPAREQDFTAIGQALQSGNLSAAQQAFSNLKATFEHNASGTGSTNSSTASTGASGLSGNEIVLNLANSGGASGPITINITNQTGGGEQLQISTGSNAQPVTLNLPANSNEEVVLNLLGATQSTSGASATTTSSTTPAAGATSNGALSVSA